MGDGHLDTYYVSVSTNSETDIAHAQFVANLLTEIFGVTATIRKGKDKKVLIIVLSSKMACEHLASLGMPKGNKLIQGLYPPAWIRVNSNYSTAFIRGLIDTDGCVYEDRHAINGKSYASTCIAFTSASLPLLDFMQESLLARGITPTRWGCHVRIRRKADVLRYVKEIGFSNSKHAQKIRV